MDTQSHGSRVSDETENAGDVGKSTSLVAFASCSDSFHFVQGDLSKNLVLSRCNPFVLPQSLELELC
jgi:hypothetical protein